MQLFIVVSTKGKLNMKSLRILLTVFLFIKLFCVHGQTQMMHIAGYGSSNFKASFLRVEDRTLTSKSIVGSEYLTKEWMIGELRLKNNIKYKSLFRFNIASQNIELIYNNDTLVFMDPFQVLAFNFMGKKFIYDIITSKDHFGPYIQGAYLEVLVDGRCQLLKKYDKSISESNVGLRYGAAETSINAYQTQTSLFIRVEENTSPTKFYGKKNELLHLLGKKRKEIEEFISLNKLNLKKENDLIKIISFYNQII
ncbi:hypothetical protein [Tenuifilum thalassicum]|uniref:Uncharacterized protein n=1 Tax=Tenuifilum thalassicum TaxID=2590900 RepID=A0A7D4BC12_9BACT|nr:hypothetical protein [Tenuifilum thalassicum]QKG80400.1 hypothetical protein FHG85_09030 [Tenuifilum thalassicum]